MLYNGYVKQPYCDFERTIDMLWIYYFTKPAFWIIPWIVQAIGYYGVLRKMGEKGLRAVIPFLAEKKIASILFVNKRSFWHPFIMASVFVCTGFYLRSSGEGMATVVGMIMCLLGLLAYGFFLIRLYMRLCKSFHKKFLFKVGMIMLPALFLILLSRKKEVFYGAEGIRGKKIENKILRTVYDIFRELFFAAEMIGVTFAVGFVMLKMYMPRPVVMLMHHDLNEQIANIESDGSIITRKESMGDDYVLLDEIPTGRDYYFPDHSKDRNVVVLTYVIGSNLENQVGLASMNITQMKDATKQGPNLKFVMEAGGSNRWFTSGIKNKSVGRYVIENGKVTLVESLDDTVSMSQEKELEEFLNWAKENYPADRYMLVLWDHGGGLGSGYGQDDLNKREDNRYGTLMVNEIEEAIKQSGMKFDLIGFDACLMQNVETAKVLEPYADYYLASEETESGYGWYYTSAFGMLAKDPTISTEDFGRELISIFDVYNTTLRNGKPQPETTLSLIDLTRIRPAFDKLAELYMRENMAIKADPADYTDISLAARKSYIFDNQEQIDLIDYLSLLDGSDYDDTICSPEELNKIINYFKAAIVYRNAVSNDGINGLALTFPYDSIASYKYERDQYDRFIMTAAKQFYDDYFSIMAYIHKDEYSKPVEVFGVPIIDGTDYTKEDWYVEGFENYVDAPAITDIPLIETEYGWQLELPDSVWRIIADSQQTAYQKSEDGWRYLGRDVAGSLDENDHPMISTDGTWIHINDQLVCYEAEPAVSGDEGVTYKGTVKAMLNDETKIILKIEWDPITEDTGLEVYGHVVGYTFADNETSYMEKGLQEIKPGDTLQFLFDYYDEEGKLIKTEVYGNKVHASSMAALKVEDKPLGECDLRYGIILTDVYQRDFVTEMIESHIGG